MANISLTFHADDGFYTGSPLLYVTDDHNITVIEVDTGKVVDVIYTGKESIVDVAVSPDYYTLYVLYHGHADPARFEPGYQGSPYGNFIMIIDLYTKQIIADTWYSGDYQYVIGGSASNLVLSPDGKYLYFAANNYDAGMIFQYDTVAHKYTRGINTKKIYSSEGYFSSNAWDLTVSPDGKYLFFVDSIFRRLTLLNLPDLSRRAVYASLEAEMEAWTLTINPDLSRYYMSGGLREESGYCVVAIDPAAYSPQQMAGTSTMKFTPLISLIRLGPDRQTMYVIQPGEKRVIGYNVNTPSDYRIYFTGTKPEDITFSPDGSKLYVYCYGNSYVMVFDINTGMQLSGTPIAIGPDRNLKGGWMIGDIHKMEMGPVPQADVFVNDSAYRAHRLSGLLNMVGTSNAARYVGALVTKENNASASGWSSFALEPGTGMLVPLDLGSAITATATPAPGQKTPAPGKATIIPFPEMQQVAPGPQGNQSQDQSQQDPGNVTGNVTATPGSTGNTPMPAASVTATPGFEAIICLTCLIIATIAVRKKGL